MPSLPVGFAPVLWTSPVVVTLFVLAFVLAASAARGELPLPTPTAAAPLAPAEESAVPAQQAVPAQPPVAPVRPVVDDYFGVKLSDPYRYFENLSDPEVRAWFKGQGDYAAATLKAIPGRDALLARIRELDEAAPYRVWPVRRWPNGDLHYNKRLANENLDKLYFLPAGEKVGGPTERLLVDPEQFSAADGKHASISFVRPSPDGRHIAFGIAIAGSEQTVLRVRDVATGKDLPETIDRLEHDYLDPYWLPDGSGFVYGRRRARAAGAPETDHYKDTYSSLHILGTDPANDPVIFSRATHPAAGLSEADFPAVALTPGSRYMIGQVRHGDARELTLFVAPITALSAAELARNAVPWTPICVRTDEVEDYAVHGDDVYLKTAKNAPTYNVVRLSLAKPDLASAKVVVEATPAMVVRGIAAAKDGLYVERLDAGVEKVFRLPYGDGAAIEAIQTPAGEPSASAFGTSTDVDGALIATSSWVRGGKMYTYDPAKKSLADAGLKPAGKFDHVEGFESIDVQVPSHDGVKVPLSIVYKMGLKLDGSHPTLVNGYGAYGMTTPPHFDPIRLAWLERGGVLAYASVRGGGALGKPWHQGGQKTTKPNTWKDFIACCEYLVKQGYTSPGKLAGQGGSAGGILIGRSVTERPDLFAAAIANVGCLDAVRMETTANGVPNIQEFGTFTTEEGFKALLAMSAYANVKDGVKYPAVLLTHGLNDPRVEPWQSAKMTARLQAATGSGKPILFRVDAAAGHGIGSTKTQRQEQRADEWAFLLWQMGEKIGG
ncbi:prolyl oligopeptidase family serine peptidase [Humisphaera borealis]|uniref:prolyl oligopeptidase n=1 Tax=Humisphaera borealis TaxID=2807512 RepID=A0A7M2WSA2_9BACT|nr:prolyl oligopeptidase family serine peptidase [Humisphaera borealis]QOV88387.1 S9 family peptidase [Humisphaera borealis]